jgi:hypothetical protein
MELLKQVLEQGRTLKDPQAQEDAEVSAHMPPPPPFVEPKLEPSWQNELLAVA